MSKGTILISSRAFFGPEGKPFLQPIREAGYEVVMAPRPSPLTEEELSALLKPGIIGTICGMDHYTRRVLSQAKSLRVISRTGVGLDNIDLPSAQEYGVKVCSTPYLNANAVADFTFALILALARRIPEALEAVRSGQWREITGVELAGKVLGIIGLGTIGKKVAERAKGFGMQVIAYDPVQDHQYAEEYSLRYCDLEELLRVSDFVTLHCTLTPENRGMIDEQALRKMKPTAFLVNCARGALVEERALLKALQEGWIAGAALDAFVEEPLPPDHPFLSLSNCLYTPHTAYASGEANRAVCQQAVKNLLEALQEE